MKSRAYRPLLIMTIIILVKVTIVSRQEYNSLWPTLLISDQADVPRFVCFNGDHLRLRKDKDISLNKWFWFASLTNFKWSTEGNKFQRKRLHSDTGV